MNDKMTKHDEELWKIIERFERNIITSLASASAKTDIELARNHAIAQINILHKNEVELDEGKYLDLLIRWRTAFIERVSMKVEKKHKQWFIKLVKENSETIEHAIAQAGIEKLGKEIVE